MYTMYVLKFANKKKIKKRSTESEIVSCSRSEESNSTKILQRQNTTENKTEHTTNATDKSDQETSAESMIVRCTRSDENFPMEMQNRRGKNWEDTFS